jgi:aspartyl-tRNA(Asn)/glutamyl-tRNA(Gln) amidotransferase subunit C
MAVEIPEALVQKIAKLANLAVEPDEVRELSEKLGAIFGYIAALERVDVTGVAPLSHALEQHTVTRADEVQPSLAVEDLLMNAPDAQGRFIKVPIVIEPGEGA